MRRQAGVTRSELSILFSLVSCLSAGACVGSIEEANDVGQWPQTGSHDGSVSPNDPQLPGSGRDGGLPPSGVIPPTGDPLQPGDPEDPSGEQPPPVVSDGCDVVEEERYAQNLQLAQVAIYQAVKIPLFEAGAAVTTRSAPVVQGKPALVRVFVQPAAGYAARTLRAVLTLKSGGVETKRVTQDLMVRSASADATLPTTFNFELAGDDIVTGTEFAASVVETECKAPRGTSASARAPVSGTLSLRAEAIPALEIVLVPTTINGITSMPSTTQVEKMRAALRAYYPVPDVRISVRAIHDLSASWNCAGDSWSCALDGILNLRSQDRVASNVYYYGLLNPASTFSGYCRSSCVLGIAYGVSQVRPSYQGAVGIGYDNANTLETLVHEIAHAHGRSHAPCAPGNSLDPRSIDASYPHSDARIGNWGWDFRSGALVPETHKDIMSYCQPTWISPYNYQALAVRSTAVNKMAYVYEAQSKAVAEPYRNLIVSGDGLAHWGSLVEAAPAPGEATPAELFDASANPIGEITVYRASLADSASEFLFVPVLPPEAATLHYAGRSIALPSVP